MLMATLSEELSMLKGFLLKIREEKDVLRAFFKKKRKEIPLKRRLEASQNLYEVVYPKLVDYEYVLSFASLPEEIDTSLLNQKLYEEQRLVLPKVGSNNKIEVYQILDFSKLEKSSFNIFEPISEENKYLDSKNIGCILVPGLGFDSAFHRLGYGKGHYDIFLNSVKKAFKLGIGFKEQLAEDLFPLFQHDVKLDDVMLF